MEHRISIVIGGTYCNIYSLKTYILLDAVTYNYFVPGTQERRCQETCQYQAVCQGCLSRQIHLLRISVLCVICDMPGTYYAPYPLVEKSLKHVWKTSFLYFCIFRADANYYDGKRNRNRIFQHFRRLFLPGALKKCPLLSH